MSAPAPSAWVFALPGRSRVRYVLGAGVWFPAWPEVTHDADLVPYRVLMAGVAAGQSPEQAAHAVGARVLARPRRPSCPPRPTAA